MPALADRHLDLAISRNLTVGLSYTGQIGSGVTDHGQGQVQVEVLSRWRHFFAQRHLAVQERLVAVVSRHQYERMPAMVRNFDSGSTRAP